MKKKTEIKSRSIIKRNIFRIFIAVILIVVAFGMHPEITVQAQQTITFSGAELLGRATDTSITIKIVPDSAIQYYYQYGVSSGVYSGQTATITAAAAEASSTVISGLTPNTHYYYRMQYNYNNTGWVARPEYSFWTQRAKGTTFVFDVTSDSHVNIILGNSVTWTSTMNNVAADHPDFLIDLGDTFAMDNVTTRAVADANYLFQREFFDITGHSAGIYVMAGNHEQTEGWHRDDTADINLSPPVLSTNMMKKYYLNPVPDDFYGGNSEIFSYIEEDGLLGDYYSWEWGDALFVVIDPFWYTTIKPYKGNTGGGETSDPGSGDRWDWTLGKPQFDWLKQTLETSQASYKFIFSHHMVGGSEDYVRGGANPAHLVEWGGYNVAGTTYEWASKRPGWGDQTVHDILVTNKVSAFIHGHDHQYAYEKRDGVVYLSMPAAGFSGGFGIYTTGSGYTVQALPSPGHVRVTVTPDAAIFDYIATSGGAVNYSFEIEPNQQPDEILGDVNADGIVNSTDALIILAADVGGNVTSFCPMTCGDVNGDGSVNSTDALILLTFEVGLSVPYAVGQPGCPTLVTPPPGCAP